MLTTNSISHSALLYISLMRLSLYHLTPVVRLGRLCCPRSEQKRFVEESPPAHQTLNKTTSLPPSSFTLQGRLTLATPLQLACSLWCGLSGGEHTSAAPCSLNEMPVSEGASRTVKKKQKKNSWAVHPPPHGWWRRLLKCTQPVRAGQATNFT